MSNVETQSILLETSNVETGPLHSIPYSLLRRPDSENIKVIKA